MSVVNIGLRISWVESSGCVQAVPSPPPWVVWNGFCWARQCSQLSPRISLIINIRCQPSVWETLWLIFISRPPPDMRTQNRLTYLFNNFQVAASFSVCGAWRFFQIFLISPNLENLSRDEEAYLVLNKHVTSRLSSRPVNWTLQNFTVPLLFNPSLRHYAIMLIAYEGE